MSSPLDGKIENVIGSRYADIIHGNATANRREGEGRVGEVVGRIS
jgi:hypothetical protein